MSRLHADIWGGRHKEVVELLPGSFAADPMAAWAKQRTLADRYRLIVVHRLGYGTSHVPDHEDEGNNRSLEADVCAIAELLEGETHIVGFSYSGLIALLVAAESARFVRSLAVIEPPLYGLLCGDTEVEALISRLQPVYNTTDQLSPDTFYYAFLQGLGQKLDPTAPLPSERQQAAKAAAKEAVPWR